MHAALIAVRLVHFASIIAVFGAAAFRLYGFAGVRRSAERGALAAFDRWHGRWLLGAALIALASGLLMVPCVTAMMAGSMAAAIDPATVAATLFGTAFGRAWCWHLGFTALLVIAAAFGPRRGGPVLGLALLTLASLALVGHAADPGRWSAVGHQVNDAVHLLAAGLWLGGLVPLGWILRRARDEEGDGFAALAPDVVPAFSHMGYAAVALIAVSGVINSAFLLGSATALAESPYGRLLSLKILLYLAMVGIALFNRFRLTRGLLAPTTRLGALRRLRRSVSIEQGLAVAILVAVSILGTWPPPPAAH